MAAGTGAPVALESTEIGVSVTVDPASSRDPVPTGIGVAVSLAFEPADGISPDDEDTATGVAVDTGTSVSSAVAELSVNGASVASVLELESVDVSVKSSLALVSPIDPANVVSPFMELSSTGAVVAVGVSPVSEPEVWSAGVTVAGEVSVAPPDPELEDSPDEGVASVGASVDRDDEVSVPSG